MHQRSLTFVPWMFPCLVVVAIAACGDGSGRSRRDHRDDHDPRRSAHACEGREASCGELNTVLTCDEDGVLLSRIPCPAGDACVMGEGFAACEGTSCDVGEIGCIDDVTAYVCDETGARMVVAPCRSDQRCEEGLCVITTAPTVCEPGARWCVGNSAQRCSDDGTAVETPRSCGADLCVAGECVPDVCTPQCNERVCGVDPVCGSSCGTCGTDEACVDGACVSSIPAPANLAIEAVWEGVDVDVDLYVKRGTTPWCDPDSCYWATCLADRERPDWDGDGAPSAGDPLLDVTDVARSNPERVVFALPAEPAQYWIGAHVYASPHAEDRVSIELQLNDGPLSRFSATVPLGAHWRALILDWDGVTLHVGPGGTYAPGFDGCQITDGA